MEEEMTKLNATEARALVERLTGFTRGPLHVRTAGVDAAVCSSLGVVAECFGAVSHVSENTGRAESDAKLYAAAPDLHRHLTAALDEIERLKMERDELDALLNEGLATDDDTRRQARAEGIREAAEIAFEADDCYLARNGILALLDTDALTPPQEGRTNE